LQGGRPVDYPREMPVIIDDLSKDFPQTSIGTRWQLVSDAVMGGLSSGRMTCSGIAGRKAVRMQGRVSLENNGGFIQIALDLGSDGSTVDASACSGIAVDALGNGEEYGLHLRTPDLTRPWQSYRQTFRAEPAWREIRLPFGGFSPHRTEVPLDVRRLRRLGLVAIGRAFEADLAISGVRFY
jgi:hypothetical protein